VSVLRRTERRHKLLAEVAAGRMQVRIGMQWNLVRKPDEWLSPIEKRTARDLRTYITHAPTGWDRRPTDAELTEPGWLLLAAWNEQHGEVQL
jgi:hypothetical protein